MTTAETTLRVRGSLVREAAGFGAVALAAFACSSASPAVSTTQGTGSGATAGPSTTSGPSSTRAAATAAATTGSGGSVGAGGAVGSGGSLGTGGSAPPCTGALGSFYAQGAYIYGNPAPTPMCDYEGEVLLVVNTADV